MRLLLAVTLVLLAAVTSACRGGDRPSLTVGAASSLQPLLDSVKPGFEEASGVELRISYGASGALALQIEQGAPIDVFVSAGDYIGDLAAGGFLRQHSIVEVGFGLLVPVRPAFGGVEGVAFAEAEHIAIANPETAPYGAAAKAQLQAAGLWDNVEPRIVYAESALQAFQFAKAGEVDYAFVPLPLVRSSPDGIALVDRAALGLKATSVTYTTAINAAVENAEHADAFIEYLMGSDAQLTDHGYNVILGPGPT